MKRHELKTAAPGHYVFDADSGDVLGGPCEQHEAISRAAALGRRGVRAEISQVVDVVTNVVELCMSERCPSEVFEVVTPSAPLRLDDNTISPGTVLRLCRVHAAELRALARVQGLAMQQVAL